MKNIIFVFLIVFASCSSKELEKDVSYSTVISCEEIELISIQDQINYKNKWKIKTSSGITLIDYKNHQLGDTVITQKSFVKHPPELIFINTLYPLNKSIIMGYIIL